MALPRVTIAEDGTLAIPREIRNQLGIGPSDEVEFEIVDGRAMLSPVRKSILDFFMSVPANVPPLTNEELENAFEQGVADELAAALAQESSGDR